MKKILSMVALVVATLFLSPAPAQAGNGAADFYLATSCSIADGARLSVTNWDTNASYQRYHMDLNPDNAPITYYPYAIYFNGVKVPGGNNDVYKTLLGHGRNTIKGVWGYSNGMTVSCSVTL